MKQEHCPVCEHASVQHFLRRESVPVHQNEVMRTQEAAHAAEVGTLDLAVCGRCGFIFNSAFDLRKLRYGTSYDNTQTFSPSFREHVDGLANYLIKEKGVRESTIVEVGCGNAYFLHRLVDDPAHGNRGIGFDPSYSGEEPSGDDRLQIERRYFDASCRGIHADIVVTRHVIEHVPDPVGMLRAVLAALQSSPDARVFCETPCVDWILRRHVFWDFFYEHCSYFTAASLATAFQQAGFSVDSVRHVFGGQYLWLEGRVTKLPSPVSLLPGEVPQLASEFATEETGRAAALLGLLSGAGASRPVAIWGAGAKGATMVNLLDRERKFFDCLIDINPNKQGCYVAGTGHPIVSLEEAARRGVSTALLMNPNYKTEVEAMIQTSGHSIPLMDFPW